MVPNTIVCCILIDRNVLAVDRRNLGVVRILGLWEPTDLQALYL